MPTNYEQTDTRDEIAEGTAVPPVGTSLGEVGVRAIQGLLDADIVEQPSGVKAPQEPSDTRSLQEQQAIDALQQIEGTRPETWEGLTESERASVLQDIEIPMADVQGRPPAEVAIYPDPPGECGYYDPHTSQIQISDRHLMNDLMHDVVETVVHEGRHAYQYRAIANPGFHDDPAEVEAWRDNLENYLDPQLYGYEKYYNQPVERDAWSYGARIADGVYGERE